MAVDTTQLKNTTPPKTPEPEYMKNSFGMLDTPTGSATLTASSPDVMNQKVLYPGISTDVAIGNVLMQRQKQATVPAPTVLTSQKAEARTQENKQELAKIQESYAQPVQTAQATQPTQVKQSKTDTEQTDQIQGLSEIDAETSRYMQGYNDMMKGLDADAQAQIQSIQQEYAGLREQMAVTNKAIRGAVETAGYRSGRSRYAPEIQMGIVGAEVKAGQARISQLIQEEQSVIRAAEAAAQSKKWDMFNQQMDFIRQARQEKNVLVQQHKDNVFKAMQEERQIQKDNLSMFLQQQDYLMKKEDRMMPGIAASLVSLDNEGNVIQPNIDEVTEYANALGIEPATLLGTISARADEMRKMSMEDKEFYLDQQLGNAQLESVNFNNQKNIALLPYEIQQKVIDIKTGEVNLDRLQFLTEKEKQLLPFELQMQAIQLEKGSYDIEILKKELYTQEQEALQETLTTGQLTEKQITELDKTPQLQKLQLLKGLKTSLLNYKNLVEKYGTAKISPTQKKLLEQARADAVIAWKEAAKLGALTGPDLEIIENAIPRSTPKEGAGFFGTLFGPTFNAPILKALEQSINKTDVDAGREIEGLQARGQNVYDNSYTQSIISPFLDSDLPTMYHNYNAFINTATEQEILNFNNMLIENGINQSNEEDVTEALKEFQGGFKQDQDMSLNYSETLNKVIATEIGSKKGECGAYVNKITGLGVGDSYDSKMAKMDIKNPKKEELKPGQVFTMPYSWTGHIGFIIAVNDDDTVTVKDSNWSLDKKVKTHKIAISKITGVANV